jgi:hypothetical protein
MTSLKKLMAVAAAVAMVGSPLIAAASPASKLSVAQVSKARAGTKTAKASEIAGASTLLIVAGLAVAAGIIVAVSSGGSKSP